MIAIAEHTTAVCPTIGGFAEVLLAYRGASGGGLLTIFDARVHTLRDLDEARENVVWRQADATKNAITMAPNTLRSHQFLMGRPTDDHRELLRGTGVTLTRILGQ